MPEKIRKSIFITAFLLFLIPAFFSLSAQTPYEEYLSQLDNYRTALSEFKIAKNEYDKFQTLTSRQDALGKTRLFLVSRDRLLISYLTFLSGKVRETAAMPESERLTYLSLIDNEIGFLTPHLTLATSISSISDAIDVSSELETRYLVVQTSVYETMTAISVANLNHYAAKVEKIFRDLKLFLAENRTVYDQETQSLSDRWSLSIENKLKLYRQKINSVKTASGKLKPNSPDDLETEYAVIIRTLGEARADLTETSSFLAELVTVLKYKR